MIIKEILSDEDKVNIKMDVIDRSNVTKSNLKRWRIRDSLCSVFGIIVIYWGIIKEYRSLIIIFGVVTIVCLLELIFARRIYLHRTQKSIQKQDRIIKAQYNIPEGSVESITEIKEDTVETRELGNTLIYKKEDFIRDYESNKFYILEFTNGRFLYFKKETFKNEEEYFSMIKEIHCK